MHNSNKGWTNGLSISDDVIRKKLIIKIFFSYSIQLATNCIFQVKLNENSFGICLDFAVRNEIFRTNRKFAIIYRMIL